MKRRVFGLVVVLIGVLSLCACKEAEEPELSEMDEFIAGFKAKHPDGYQLSDGWYEETYYRNGTMELFDQIKRKFVGYCSFTDSDKSIPDFVSFKTNDFEYWTLEGYYWRNDKQIERHSNLKRGNYYWWETKYDYSLDTSFQFTVTKAPTLFTNKISGCFGYFNFLDEYNYLPEIIAHPTRYSSSHPFNSYNYLSISVTNNVIKIIKEKNLEDYRFNTYVSEYYFDENYELIRIVRSDHITYNREDGGRYINIDWTLEKTEKRNLGESMEYDQEADVEEGAWIAIHPDGLTAWYAVPPDVSDLIPKKDDWYKTTLKRE